MTLGMQHAEHERQRRLNEFSEFMRQAALEMESAGKWLRLYESSFVEAGCTVPLSASPRVTIEFLETFIDKEPSEALGEVWENIISGKAYVLHGVHAMMDPGHKIVMDQAMRCMNEGLYAIACIGMFSIFDKMHDDLVGFKPSNKNLLNKIASSLEKLEGSRGMSEMVRACVIVNVKSISRLYVGSDHFTGLSTRNRVMHGHDLDKVTKEDCIRVALAIATCESLSHEVLTNFKSLMSP